MSFCKRSSITFCRPVGLTMYLEGIFLWERLCPRTPEWQKRRFFWFGTMCVFGLVSVSVLITFSPSVCLDDIKLDLCS